MTDLSLDDRFFAGVEDAQDGYDGDWIGDHAAVFGPYFALADPHLRIFSIFDDLAYDRADADMLSPPMRRHAIEQLKSVGFVQTSGSVLRHRTREVFCRIPKPQTLGAAPFDVLRYETRRAQDFVILTPTQTACQIIDGYPPEEALARLVALVRIQPINIDRIFDFMDRKAAHRENVAMLGAVKSEQRKAVGWSWSSPGFVDRKPL